MKTCYYTFHSVSDALAFEKKVKETELDVQLVPVPREISSSCGVAAMFSEEIAGAVRRFAGQERLETDGYHELEPAGEKQSLLDRLRRG